MFLQLSFHCKTISLSPKKNIKVLLHNRLQAIKYKERFFTSNPEYSYFWDGLMIRSSETVKTPDIKALKKLIPDTNFNTEIPDMFGKFRTHGNPRLGRHEVKFAKNLVFIYYREFQLLVD